MPKSTTPLPDWELVLSSAARLQRILPGAVLVGGTASAIHAEHRFSRDADHVLTDPRQRFDEVLAQLESLPKRCIHLIGSTSRTAANYRCSSCRYNLPTYYPTTWKKPISASTKTSILAGTTGRQLKRLAPILLP